MSETNKRNTHLPEFKAKVGLEAVRSVKTVNQMAQGFFALPIRLLAAWSVHAPKQLL
jgi:transposase